MYLSTGLSQSCYHCVFQAMARHPLLMAIFLWSLLLSFSPHVSQSDTPFAGRPGLFWVAADKTQCNNYSNGSDCDTLDGYLDRNDVNFSFSDTTWVFLHGEHVVHKQLFTMARNVTLLGEDRCAATAQRCTTCLKFDSGGTGEVHVWKSEQITIQYLSFSTKGMDGLLRVESTRDFQLNCVHFLDDSEKKRSTQFDIVNPHGALMLQNSHFSKNQTPNMTLANCTQNERNCTVTVIVSQCRFECGTYKSVQMKLAENLTYYSAIVNITNTIFSKCGLNVEVEKYPTVYSMELSSVNISQGNTGFHLSAPLYIQEQNDSYFSNLSRAQTVFRNCTFHNVSSSSLSISLSKKPCECLTNSTKTYNHVITILNSQFERSSHTLKGPFTVTVQVQDTCRSCSACNHAVPPQLLTLTNSTFTSAEYLKPSKKIMCILAALCLKNLQGYRVVMAGENRIMFNEGYGLMLENSQLELQGYNEISNNAYGRARGGGGGIYMSSDSQLLLVRNSHLNVSANTGMLYGGGIHVSHAGRSIQTLNEFVDCYVYKLTCPGWCFFQFVNSDGQYVNETEIPEHNATVTLLRNTATLGGNNVFNGHFQNCSLQTAHGTIPAGEELICSVFHQYPPMEEEVIPSFPYAICLCNGDELNCIRSHTLVIETYPVEQIPIIVCVKGDWQQVVQVMFRVTENETMHQTSIMNCTTVYTLESLGPDSSHVLTLEASLAGGNANLKRNLVVQVYNSCSTGLQFDYKHGCVCNAILKLHGFNCAIRTNTTTYKSGQPNYWIGTKENHLLFSPNCPSPYCHSDTLQHGLSLDENRVNEQCKNGRRGLLCSECPSGYSSVFGLFKCKECSSVWLLQLPLYAFAGIFIIAILFLFNLTLLQGTIMGVVLYTNIMRLMADNIQERAWGPLFFILSVLNLEYGAGVCFFDGMDEFWKALLQFAFPFYLFTLLIVIIIITHKCGYRMFRKARFIARRAVPVLATIMLLTYTSLVNAVIAPLRYTTLYNADSTQGEVVWLYQPSLPFFGGRHLVLGVLSIAVTLLYLIPFTFTMLFGDLMRRYFHKLWFSHFMDVLHGTFRWPLGFWIGLRLLVRVILMGIYISTKANTATYCTVIIVGTLLVAQLLVRPFREPIQFRKSAHVHPNPTNLSPQRIKCYRGLKQFFRTYHTPLLDTLFVLNIVISSATIVFGYNVDEKQKNLSKAGVNVLILLALAQFAAILVYHAYNFFPVPEKAHSCAQSCWSTMRTIPSMLKDTQCCQRGAKEEEDPRRSPTPILTLRPLETDENYESESETSSYNEQPPPEEVGVRETTLQEPLLTSDL